MKNIYTNEAISNASDMISIVVDVVSGVPLMSLLRKIYECTNNISDALLLNKVIVFFETANINEGDKEKILQHFETEQDRKNIAEKIIFYVNAANDVKKIEMMAKVFRACIESKITKDDFTLFWAIIDKNIPEHLELYFKTKEITYDMIIGVILLYSGLFNIDDPNVLWNGRETTYYTKSELGYRLCEIIFDSREYPQ